MLFKASPEDLGEIIGAIARITAERDAALADAKRARAERDEWAAKYDALVREIIGGRAGATRVHPSELFKRYQHGSVSDLP